MAYRSGLLPGLFERELLGFRRSYAPNHFSNAFTCQGKHAGVIRVDPDGEPCPPYAITYNKVVNGCRFLTVGDEEGSVSIVDTWAEQLPTSLYTDHSSPPRAKWLAHNNTIFDMAWAKNDSVLYTASGDQHVGVWDTTAGRLLVYCAGHDGSVKAVCPHSNQPDVFASGSRDGAILMWDLRSPSQWSAAKRRMQLSPVMRIDTATAPGHNYGQTAAALDNPRSTPGSGRKSKSPCVTRRSVTSLLFVKHEHTMISSNDCDGVVKLWDLRKMTAPTGELAPPAVAGPGSTTPTAASGSGRRAAGRGGGRSGGKQRASADSEGTLSWLGFSCGSSRSSRPAGITCMALSPAGDMLLVSSIDSCHYLYRVSSLDQEPVACLTGHRANSFCIKSCFSPSGDHVLSGSTDKKAYIWDTRHPANPPVSLPGHTGEVTAVAWCPGDHCQIATAADDATLRVWTLDRGNSRYERNYEQTNVLFNTSQQQQRLWEKSGLQQSQQRQHVPEAASCKAAAAVAEPASSAVTAEGAAAAVKLTTVHSISPPTTPQLPFWNNSAAAGAADGSAVAGSAQKAAAEAVCETPAGNRHKAVCVGVSPSLPPMPPPSARRSTPRFKQLTIAQQLSAIKAKKQSAAAANAGYQGANPPEQPAEGNALQQQQQQLLGVTAARDLGQQQQQLLQQSQHVAGTSVPAVSPAAVVPSLAGFGLGPEPQVTQHQGCSSQQAAAAATTPAAAAAVSPAVADQQQAFADWMNTLTPSPASSQELEQQQQQQANTTGPAALSGGLCLTQQQQRQQRGSRASFRRGGIVELSTPWDLPTPIRQQRQQEQAALEAERLQQSLRLRGLSLQDCDNSPGSSSGGGGVSGRASSVPGASSGGGVVNPAVSCCRLLQDEFEVYCDGDDVAAAPAASGAAGADSQSTAATPRGLSCQENAWQLQQLGPKQGMFSAAAAGVAARAVAGDDIIEESPADGCDMVPCSLPQDMVPCSLPQPNPTQQTQQQAAAADQHELELLQLLEQQQVQGVRSPTRKHRQPSPLSRTGPPAAQSAPATGVGALLTALGAKPGAVLLGTTARRPLGDLSPLLPVEPDLASPRGVSPRISPGGAGLLSPGRPAANIAAVLGAGSSGRPGRSSGGRRKGLTGTPGGLQHRSGAVWSEIAARNSPVRVLKMGGDGSSASPVGLAAADAGAGAGDSPMLQMLLHGSGAAGELEQPLQQQDRHAAAQGSPLASPTAQQQQAAQHHQHMLLSPPRHASPGGRKLSRLGDRQISPLLFPDKQPTHPRITVQQSGVHAAQQAAGGVANILGCAAGARVVADQVQQHEGLVQHEQQQKQPSYATLPKSSRADPVQADVDQAAGFQHEQQQQKYPTWDTLPYDDSDDLEAAPAEEAGETEAMLAKAPQQQRQTPASTGRKPGGIKRSYVFGTGNRKKQCTLSDLWTAKEPAVEDGASRFSGF